MDASGLTELIPVPAAGRRFVHARRPGLADCAPSGRMRLDAMARWLQDVAYEDVEDARVQDLALWVVRRTRLRVARFPRFGERLTVTTFCSGLGRMWAERRTTIARAREGRAEVEAVALWVHLDPQTGRPSRVSEAELSVYASAAAGRRVRARLRHPSPDVRHPSPDVRHPSPDVRHPSPDVRHPAPAPIAQAGRWTFRASECDLADHVNNAAYWVPLEEELLGQPDPDQLDAEIEFRTPAQPGRKQLLRHDGQLWIVDDDGEVHASVMRALVAGGEARPGVIAQAVR